VAPIKETRNHLLIPLLSAVLQGPYLPGEGPRSSPPGQLGINMMAQAVVNGEPGKTEEVVVCFGIIDILQVGGGWWGATDSWALLWLQRVLWGGRVVHCHH
jgi:hypothetical protein